MGLFEIVYLIINIWKSLVEKRLTQSTSPVINKKNGVINHIEKKPVPVRFSTPFLLEPPSSTFDILDIIYTTSYINCS